MTTNKPTTIEALQLQMVNLAKEFQAGNIELDPFIEAQAKISGQVAEAKAAEVKAAAQAVKAAREAEAGAREVVALEAAIALEGFNPLEKATAVITINPGDTGPLFGCRVTLLDGTLEAIALAIGKAGYNKLAYKPTAEVTFNSDGIVDVELKVKAATMAKTTDSCKGKWHQGDVGPVSLAKAYESSMDNEAKDDMLELDRRIRVGEIAKASYGNGSWNIKVAAVKRHGWEKAA